MSKGKRQSRKLSKKQQSELYRLAAGYHAAYWDPRKILDTGTKLNREGKKLKETKA